MRWLGPLGLAAAFAALAAWSWGRWTDVHIDFGNELYVAWRLSEGDALYRDVAHRHGPLPHLWNALWFRGVGVSLRTLVAVNLAVLAGIAALGFALLARACGRAAATLAVGVLLGVFAFSQYVAIANFNYVTPYHHHQTHALALSLAMLLGLSRGLRGERAGWGLAGPCLGGVLLTKAELALPALLTGACALALGPALRLPGARGWRPAAALLGGALAPVALVLAWLSSQMPVGIALAGVAGPFAFAGPGVLDDPFYARVAGTDDLAGNLGRMLRASVLVLSFAAAAALADRAVPERVRALPWSALAGGLLSLGLLAFPRPVAWLGLARALPVTTALVLLWLARECARGSPERRLRLAPLLLFAVWSLALLGKIVLHARFDHYGFALAMPATLLLVAALAALLPERLRVAWGGGGLARALAVAAVIAGVLSCLRVSHALYARKTFRVGSGADAILAEAPRASPRPAHVKRALERLEALAPPGSTLLVLPEGIALNYWLRMENPTRFHLFLPTEIAAFGEAAMLADLEARPPDFVALVHRGHREFGVGPFGEDPRYGRGLVAWIEERYERVERIGAEPFRGEGFGVVLLRRRASGDASLRR